MTSVALLFPLLCIPLLSFANDDQDDRRDVTLQNSLLSRAAAKNVPPIGYYNPNSNGGSMLTVRTRGFILRRVVAHHLCAVDLPYAN